MQRRALALILSLVISLSIFPITAFASDFTDMPNNWSTAALEKAVANGLLRGDNGKIRSEDSLTRAEMATIVNRAFKSVDKSSLTNFKDLTQSDWYYEEMAKAVQMKTFVGSGDKLNPDSNITREEAFVVLARAFKISEKSTGPLDGFSDQYIISDWAKDQVAALVSAGYLAGSNGQINPKNNITRAEFAQIMDNLVKTYISEEGEYTTDLNGNVMVNKAGVVLKGITITGDLIIGDGVGDGEVTLDDTTVTGRMLVCGGGEDSIKIIGNSSIKNIIIARVDGKAKEVKSSIGVTAGGEKVGAGKERIARKDNDKKTSGGSSSSGGDSSSDIEVNAITIDGIVVVGETLTAVTNPTGATGTYQWMTKKYDDCEFEPIAGARDKNYKISFTDINMYITVRFTATGSYSGTLESLATSRVDEGIQPQPVAPNVVSTQTDPDNEILVVGGEGKITVTIGDNIKDFVYEYSVDDGLNWADLTPGEITASATKLIKIRVKATELVGTGEEATLEIIVKGYIFDATTCKITGYTGTLKTITIPNMINGVEIKVIGKDAFKNKGITSVVIGDKVKTIEEGAFISNRITSLIIGNSVTEIKSSAFNDNKLTEITIPDSVTRIGMSAFRKNELTSVIIGDKMKTIEDNAFISNRITLLTIGGSVTEIRNGVFNDNKLTEVIIPDSVTRIGMSAFGKNELTSVIIGNSVTEIKDGAFKENKLTEIIIPNSVTTIGNDAFSKNGPSKRSGNITITPYEGTWRLVDYYTKWTKQ